MLRSATGKSIDAFGACFARQQEEQGRAWAFLPTSSGGTFTNAAADANPGEYWLRISGGPGAARLQLIAGPEAPADIVQAVQRCR